VSPHIFRKDLLKKIDGEGGRSENNRKAITIYKKYNYLKELDLSEPLYSSNFAYDNSHFGHFGLNSFVPEMQSLSFKNIKILWSLGENRRPPYFFTNQKRDYDSVKLLMFRKRPLIYVNSKVPYDESLPPLASRRSGVPGHSVLV
jgi:hypothetical protein